MAKRLVEEVFVTEGVPQFTFVRPPNFGEILVDIRRPGKPVIVEGQSGTGKTTCVRKVLERIGHDVAAGYLSARRAEDVSKVESLANAPTPGWFVIDDFHRLASDLQGRLADMAKAAAEEGDETQLPKLVLIGINEVGTELIQLVPDIAKRTGIHRIQPGSREEVEDLIRRGCAELNVTIAEMGRVFDESTGDYWLTQQLCQSICTMNEVYDTQESEKQLDFELPTLRAKVVERLKNAFYPAVKEFSRGQRFRPTNDPYFKLLRTVGSQESSVVDLDMLANAHEDVRGSINNIKKERLGVLLAGKPVCARHFYYNAETRSFAIEDPALFYFLRHLDWNRLRIDCGFRAEEKDYEYDLAISFAGENRALAALLAAQLSEFDANVFFDEYFETNFLGRAWAKEFKRIFAEDSRLVVCILDSHHAEKIWPTFERECFQPRVDEAAVIPILLDDTVFPGVPKDVVGIHFDWQPDAEEWEDQVLDAITVPIVERLESL